MKFQCLQDNLKKGLQVVSHVPHKSSNLPILQNILLRTTSKGTIECISNNLEMGVKCAIRGKVEKEGEYTFESKLLTEYVGLLPNEKIDMELRDEVLEASCANYHTKIRGCSAAEFPLLPQAEKKHTVVSEVSGFKKALEQVLFTVSSHESRPEISGVFFRYDAEVKQLIFVGTDSYRLSEKKIAIHSGPEAPFEIIIPLRTLQEVLRILTIQEGEEDRMTLYVQEGQILFTFANVEIVSRLIEGAYPEYQQIIPERIVTTAIMPTAALSRLVKGTSLFSKAGIFDIVLSFNTEKQHLTLSASSAQFGENTVTLEGEVGGENISTTLNHRYVGEGLNALESEKVRIKIVDGNTPCIFEPVLEQQTTNYLYLVMPIRK